MPKIAMLEGWDAFPGRSKHKGESTMAKRRRSRKSSKRKSGGKAKFARVARVCNKKKGKAARKACWRKHY